jgi:anti-sigma B factor antagonist
MAFRVTNRHRAAITGIRNDDDGTGFLTVKAPLIVRKDVFEPTVYNFSDGCHTVDPVADANKSNVLLLLQNRYTAFAIALPRARAVDFGVMEELLIEAVPATRSGVRILRLTGPFILRTFLDFQTLVRNGDEQTIFVDLTEVPYIDSAALGCLLGLHVSCERHHRQYALVGASDRVRNLFDMTGVGSILVCYPTLADAEKAVLGDTAST